MWVELDLDPDAFWRQTPRLFAAITKGRMNALEREQRGRAWLAWHAGLIGRMKRPPSLGELSGVRREVKKMTAGEMKGVFATLREVAKVTSTTL